MINFGVFNLVNRGESSAGKKSLALIDRALKAEEFLVSVISFWEVALLIEKRRLKMQMIVNLWRKSLIDNGLKELDLTGDMAEYSANLNDLHDDPADRMIVATAICLTATLCAADKKILGWDQDLMRLDARK